MNQLIVVLLAFTIGMGHPVIYLQLNNDSVVPKFSQIAQDFIYEQTLNYHYTVFTEYFQKQEQIQQIRRQYSQTLSQADYVIAFIDNCYQVDFYHRALMFDVPIIVFTSKILLQAYHIQIYHLIDSKKLLRQGKSQEQAKQQQKRIKQIISNFISSKKNKKDKHSIFKQMSLKIDLPMNNLVLPESNSELTAIMLVTSGKNGEGGYWTWAKNMIDILKRIAKTEVKFLKRQQFPSLQQLEKYDVIFMQTFNPQILATLSFEIRRRTYIGPFVIGQSYDQIITIGNQTQPRRYFLNGTNIIYQIASIRSKTACFREIKDAIIDCIGYEQGVNLQQWKPIFDKKERKTPLLFYKQRPIDSTTPVGIRHGVANFMINTFVYHYEALITKRKQDPKKRVYFPQELFQKLLLKANYFVAFSNFGTYQNFMYEAWSCDVPMVSFWYDPIELFSFKGGQRIKIRIDTDKQVIIQHLQEFIKNMNDGKYSPRQDMRINHNKQTKAEIIKDIILKRLKQLNYKIKKT